MSASLPPRAAKNEVSFETLRGVAVRLGVQLTALPDGRYRLSVAERRVELESIAAVELILRDAIS